MNGFFDRLLGLHAPGLHPRHGSQSVERSRSSPIAAEFPVALDVEQGPGELVVDCIRGTARVDTHRSCYLDSQRLTVRARRETELRFAMTMAATKLL